MNIYTVDAFTDKPFSGNPAAVCMVEKDVDHKWMQQVAKEMNLSETAFLRRSGDEFLLRWFTPEVEVDLCGHATLASAHVLWQEGYIPADEAITFATKSGQLVAKQKDGWIELDFPSEPPASCELPTIIKEAFDVPIKAVGKNRLDYIVEVETEEQVKHLKPNMHVLKELVTRGTIVTSKSERDGVDFVSRCFFPGVGIDEDPVTGSAHCCLGPYWEAKLGKSSFYVEQISPRLGKLHVRVEGDRCFLLGQAVTTIKGKLQV
ncbi:PhzF family phenazine biosynthesis protein [Halalkalibacterium ligniniphilum]|uniref:PhzF family phenazine biosynthesis protein n=1 Tax=Halalkalibacterium ligniniphilum TaxID=1134413 RepID=UPI0003452C75|nr:PhzF family phenazine biosynthesis protein [Halalkalibacterium ligniniphilum]